MSIEDVPVRQRELARELEAALDDTAGGSAAGGVLGGTYPDPTFAVDMATQADLDAHVNDTTDAHAASAITNTPAGTIAATTVQGALNELGSGKLAIGASAGGVLSGTYPNPGFASDMATQAELDAHTGASSAAHAASAVSNTPSGNIAATTVQAALNELDTEKAALTGAAFTGAVTVTGNIGALRPVPAGGSTTLYGDGLQSNTGNSNTAVGSQTLLGNTSGASNTGVGRRALQANTSGSNNTALGVSALIANTTGTSNVALGVSALAGNTTGGSNMAIGSSALLGNIDGGSNVAIGSNALAGNTSGANNIGIGNNSLKAPLGNSTNATLTAVNQVGIGIETGQASATQRDEIICIGYRALADGNYAVALGAGASAGAAGAVAIGKDSGGTAASTTTANEVKLGTALHTVKVAGSELVAAGGSTAFARVGGKLFDHFADAGNGTTVETDLYSDSIAASTLSTNGHSLRAEYSGIFAANATTKQLKVYFGGTVVYDSGALAVSASLTGWTIKVSVIRVSSTVVRCSVDYNGAVLTPPAFIEVTGLTLTNAQILKVTGTAGVGGANNDIVAKVGTVLFHPAA